MVKRGTSGCRGTGMAIWLLDSGRWIDAGAVFRDLPPRFLGDAVRVFPRCEPSGTRPDERVTRPVVGGGATVVEEDAPFESSFCRLAGGPVCVAMADAGRIAGVTEPPRPGAYPVPLLDGGAAVGVVARAGTEPARVFRLFSCS